MARRLRGSAAAPQARLVALSGYASADDVNRAIRAGFDYHVAKPPDIDEVLRLVAEAPSSASRLAVRDDVATDHHELDAQHAAILEAATRLRTAAPGAIWETLRFLQHHTASHFQYEDALMEDVAYPDAPAHKRQHQDFLSRVRVLQERVERQGATRESLEMLAGAVEAWVAEHVLEQDRRVAEFIREQRPEQAQEVGAAPFASSAAGWPPRRPSLL